MEQKTIKFKTGFELLEIIEKDNPKIAEKIKSNAIEQHTSDILSLHFQNVESMIRQSFVWDNTPEGYDFWRNIHKDINIIP